MTARRTVPSPVVAPLLLAFLLVLLPGCGETSAPGPPWPPDLTGSWHWVESVDRASGEPKTPCTEGYAASLLLVQDLDDPSEGSFEYLRDGVAAAAGRFSLAYEDEPGNDFVLWDPPFELHHEMQWVALGADTLRLVDAATGGFESLWVR